MNYANCCASDSRLHHPHRATLQVYLPYFVTNNFVTSQRLEAALQRHAVQVLAGLPLRLQSRVHERFLDAPDSFDVAFITS